MNPRTLKIFGIIFVIISFVSSLFYIGTSIFASIYNKNALLLLSIVISIYHIIPLALGGYALFRLAKKIKENNDTQIINKVVLYLLFLLLLINSIFVLSLFIYQFQPLLGYDNDTINMFYLYIGNSYMFTGGYFIRLIMIVLLSLFVLYKIKKTANLPQQI
jgi:hypothetical protein